MFYTIAHAGHGLDSGSLIVGILFGVILMVTFVHVVECLFSKKGTKR